LFDFVHADGVFQRAFGEDAAGAISVLSPMTLFLESVSGRIPTLLVTSVYTRGQFRASGLDTLCTTETGCRSVLPESLFSSKMCKTKNSLFDCVPSDQPVLDAFLSTARVVIVTGVTITSCVAAAVTDLRSRGYKVVIPWDCVAARTSAAATVAQRRQEWDADPGVMVVAHWADLGSFLQLRQ
jgi:hypothetical protein